MQLEKERRNFGRDKNLNWGVVMKIVKIFVFMLLGSGVQHLICNSHGIDSYYNKPVQVKLNYSSFFCKDSPLIYVPAQARGQRLEDSGGCCVAGAEVLDEGKLISSINLRDDNYELRGSNYYKIGGAGYLGLPLGLCGNTNWILDHQGRIGKRTSGGWIVSPATARSLGFPV